MEIDKNILEKFIRGEATSQERAEILEWAESSESNKVLFSKMKAEHTFSNLPNQHASPEVHKVISEAISQNRSAHQSRRIFDIITKAAAILLIPVSILTAILYFRDYRTTTKSAATIHTVPTQTKMKLSYYVNPGVKGFVMLPDSSQVWLNSGSRLDCPPQFDSTFRMVEVSGEAYFKVKSNKEWPLYVKTSKGITVEVTGTEFNLSSYENDTDFKFTLVSGNVTLIRESTNQKIAVNPLEEIIIPDNTKLSGKRASANLELNTSWKEGFLVFRNTQMSEVIKKMERWYGVDFTVKDQQLLDFNFTANFQSESITQVLEFLKITSNIGYIINEKNITLFLK